jgi:hypothetical protein
MATYPPRVATLRAALDSIAPQVDRVFLCLNEYVEAPGFLAEYNNLTTFHPERDLKDIGKFAAPDVADGDDVFLVDDDLIYAKGYVAHMMNVVPEIADHPIVLGVHGSIMRTGFRHKGYKRQYFNFPKAQAQSICVDQLGTGTIYLKGRQMPALDDMADAQGYADIRFARLSHQRDITLICVARDAGMIRQQVTDSSLYHSFTRRLPDAVFDEVKIYGRRPAHLGQPVDTFLSRGHAAPADT